MLKFIRITILGGVLFLLPFALIATLIGKLVSIAAPVAESATELLPVYSVFGLSVGILLTLILLVLVSFAAGLLARTRLAQLAVKKLEANLLGRVPAYSVLKSIGEDFISPDEQSKKLVVIVSFDDVRQMGIKTGETAEGSQTIVFLPDSPSLWTGTVVVVDSARVQETNIPIKEAFAVFVGRGVGLGKHLSASAEPDRIRTR